MIRVDVTFGYVHSSAEFAAPVGIVAGFETAPGAFVPGDWVVTEGHEVAVGFDVSSRSGGASEMAGDASMDQIAAY